MPPLPRLPLLSLLLLFFLVPSSSAAAEPEKSWKKKYRMHTSLQAGLEWDSNVYKTFGSGRQDGLFRLLAKSRGTIPWGSHFYTGWNYQGGGKKFWRRDEQDLIIQYLQAPLTWQPHRRYTLTLAPDFKYQNESDATDVAGADVNEDYWSTTTRLSQRIRLYQAWSLEPYGEFTYFRFDPVTSFSFFLERGAMLLRYQISSRVRLGAEYRYTRQQFSDSEREDREHAFSASLQLAGVPFFSARYTYQDSDSSPQGIFSFTNHRINLLMSFPLLGHQQGGEKTESGEPLPPALLSLHVMGTLQIKDFPDVFVSTTEGERFLLTGSEDDNFNSLLIKLTYHPHSHWAGELKFTRYSNELSSQENSFARSLLYGGVRYTF